MSDQPLTLSLLAKFHREVIVPDIERIVGDAVSGSEKRLGDQIARLWDALFSTRERLETEYMAIKSGIARVEERLDRVEERLGRLEVRLDGLEAEHRDLAAVVRGLDERLSRVEKHLDDWVAGERRYALRSEVEDLRTRVEGLQVQIRAVEERLKG
jgi:predicted  nucleic acid-binding Zn-ribbon protein